MGRLSDTEAQPVHTLLQTALKSSCQESTSSLSLRARRNEENDVTKKIILPYFEEARDVQSFTSWVPRSDGKASLSRIVGLRCNRIYLLISGNFGHDTANIECSRFECDHSGYTSCSGQVIFPNFASSTLLHIMVNGKDV